jgi:MFS family permease
MFVGVAHNLAHMGMRSGDDPQMSFGLRALLALLFLSVFLNYIDRSNLSIAAPMLKDELGISAAKLGWLLSAFFWTYAGMQILAGWLVDRWDVKWVFAGGFAIWSCATAITGLLHSFALLFAVRIILGMGESVAYPSYAKIVARLFPEQRRGFANAVIAAGLAAGPGVGLLFGGVLMARFGWRPFFVVLGSVSLLWLLPWARFMPSAPPVVSSTSDGPGYREILGERSLWATSLCLFCANYSLYFMVTWLPFYLVRERGFTMPEMARVGAAYFFAAAISAAICGRISDRWIQAGGSPTRVRKGFMITSLASSGVLLSAVVLVARAPSIVFLILAGVAFGLGSPNVWAIAQRLAGLRAVGRWCGVQLFCGNMSGVVVSAVTGYLVQQSGHFNSAFLVTAAVLWVGALAWAFLVGPIEPVEWSQPEMVEEFMPAVSTS